MNTQPILSKIESAMESLTWASMGGVGPDGATQAELDEAAAKGQHFAGDSDYHAMQQAYLTLAEALEMLKGLK